jgi:hypothetical protein
MRLKGDNIVNKCIDSKLDREKQWKKKTSRVVKCNKIYDNLVSNHVIPPRSQGSTSKRTITKAKKEVKKSVQNEVKDKWDKKVQKLVMQGNFTQLLIEEKENVTWQSIARKMPRSIMAFATRLGTTSLPSPDNLKWWGKRKM